MYEKKHEIQKLKCIISKVVILNMFRLKASEKLKQRLELKFSSKK